MLNKKWNSETKLFQIKKIKEARMSEILIVTLPKQTIYYQTKNNKTDIICMNKSKNKQRQGFKM